jgi:hypothetical protein
LYAKKKKSNTENTLKLGDYVVKFQEERIDGFALQRLKEDDFRELG